MTDYSNTKEPVWSVSEVNAAVRDLMENTFMPFWLEGEVGTMNIYPSGHVYLTLKDRQCQLRAVYFGGAQAVRAAGVAIGDKIEARGKLTAYPARGEYQFSIKELRTTGQGELERSFALLRKKLEAEGLFDADRKKKIPYFPQNIGIVTSPDGAAVRDFVNVFFRRRKGGYIRIYPSPVQGEKAGGELAKGVEYFNSFAWADVIVVTRGGGSMEDLWCFNDEELARAIAASRIPVVSAVGHEIDFTISDFAADLRAATPSAAAELLGPASEDILLALDNYNRRSSAIITMAMQRAESRLEALSPGHFLRHLSGTVDNFSQRLDEFSMRMGICLKSALDKAENKLEAASGKLHALDPEAVLARGYMMLVDPKTGKAITRAADVPAAHPLTGRFADGEIELVRPDHS